MKIRCFIPLDYNVGHADTTQLISEEDWVDECDVYT